MTQTQKIALVTGASRGIGAAIADELSAAGMTVIGTATTEAGVKTIDARLNPQGGVGRLLNIGEEGAIEALVTAIETQFGSIAVLVNNAGITRDNLILRMKDTEWQDVININLNAIFRANKAVLRGMMKARYGRIIAITSVIGSMGNAGQANYAAAKAGVAAMMKSLALEVGSRGITANCVAPGFIDTDMTRALPEAIKEASLSQIALKRFGNASEVAQAVAFLASDKAGYITGQTLHVNGGLLMP